MGIDDVELHDDYALDQPLDESSDSIPGSRTATELEPLARGVGREQYNLALCLRVMVALAKDEKVPLTVNELAKRSKLSVYTVRRLMQSEEWNTVFIGQLKQEVGMLLQRCAQGVARVVEKHPDSPEVQLAAMSKVNTMWKTLHQVESKKESSDAEDNVHRLMALMERDGQLKRAGTIIVEEVKP